ncbi:hypothetical protein PoB_004174400 [Plakobranchus ocellatus]|uniref:Uncharacterized protein n=1 Tax=Plakobranchus ocellatus TaxID=259542 RepID=A0AAV4BA45_9GAST|nr:hypothetical protein PoB_004174400 [Plakobranchus ocellatus]
MANELNCVAGLAEAGDNGFNSARASVSQSQLKRLRNARWPQGESAQDWRSRKAAANCWGGKSLGTLEDEGAVGSRHERLVCPMVIMLLCWGEVKSRCG